jgi:uncharacterized membrane protein YhaH (DUF805 family)
MDWSWYLFSFEGRINRAKYWLSLFVLPVCMLVALCMMFFAMLAVDGFLHSKGTQSINFGFDEIFVLLGRAFHLSLSPLDAISLVMNLFGMTVLMWIMLATSIKRLHDRDRSGWWIVPFFVLPSFSDTIQGWLGESIFSFAVGLALFILCIWGFIELGFLRGTRRTNRFGPNPLTEDEDARVRNLGLGSNGAAWEQRYELELTPHRASPMSSMHVKRGT